MDIWGSIQLPAQVTLAAVQVCAVLALAAIVELRAVTVQAQRAFKDARGAIILIGGLATAVLVALLLLSAADQRGGLAVLGWTLIVGYVAMLAVLVIMSLVASIHVAERDAQQPNAPTRVELLRDLIRGRRS